MVVDTNVLAHAVIGPAEQHQEARRALAAAPSDLRAPDSVLPELLSVLWQWTVHRDYPAAEAEASLHFASSLLLLYPAGDLAHLALDLAVRHQHSPYDTLFVALAVSLDDRVLTYDAALLKRFPDWCVHPSAPDSGAGR